MEKQEVLDSILAILNEACKADGLAMGKLVEERVSCTDMLAEHPMIQVNCNEHDGSYQVGIMGLINGICERLTGSIVAAVMKEPEGIVLEFVQFNKEG